MRELLLIAPLLLGGPVEPAVALPRGLPVVVEEMSLRFETPEGWRISRESSGSELVLYPGKSKTEPVLRVRVFHGNFSAKDLLPQMQAGLGEEEGGAVYDSREIWVDQGKRFETVTAIYRKGVQEWYARFTLVDQPDELQHGFWLFGRKTELDRQWETVKTSIASATATRAKKRTGERDPVAGKTKEPPQDPVPPRPEKTAVWQDVQSGLHVASWPVEFKPEEASLVRLSTTGVVLLPTDPEAHASTRITLARRNVGELVTPEGASQTLKEKLDAQPQVSDVRELNVRVADLSASLLRWNQEVNEEDLVFQVYFFKRGTALYRLDYCAAAEWAGIRSRRDLLKEFASGLSFE